MIHRIDVRSADGAADPHGDHIAHQIRELGHADVARVASSRIFLIDTEAPAEAVRKVAKQLLADPVVESAELVPSGYVSRDAGRRIEVHLKPGVMDPVAASTEAALRYLNVPVREVRTGRAYVLNKPLQQPALDAIAGRLLANSVVEHVHFESWSPDQFSTAASHEGGVRTVRLLDLDDDALRKLSRDGHLFLSLTEMKAVQAHYRSLGREPTDIELETVAQTWSEHCVHKTLKSAVTVVDETGRTLYAYKNLIKETIFGSTQELIRRRGDGFCLSVFKDNAGVIAFDDADAVCFKVETHNHPSAIEPYGGSATGIGGCIRDILGTGLGAKPVANTDTFCVAYPERGEGLGARGEQRPSHSSPLAPSPSPLPPGVIHPKRILQQVVAGVRDYGNRMGIPTVNGAVYFDDRYVGNPLVFAGCVGLIPRDKITKQTGRGDAIVVMGGRTGRDGIHGATFSSAELTDTHADEFSHAVQIGNAITQKKMMDVLLQARDRGLYTAVTDCGAGGLSSAVGEMGAEIGAEVDLDKVPLKYAGLRYDEIWISEAQERMVLSVPQQHVAELLKLSADEDVESTVIGTFGTPNDELILRHRGSEVGRMGMHFLHDGIPMPTRTAKVMSDELQGRPDAKRPASIPYVPTQAVGEQLLSRLAHPNVASKHWIVRQYDHEVQGGSVVKPLVGPLQIGPSDASVIRPKLASSKGVAVGCGLAPHVEDPYQMALAAMDEAIRNVVCVGGDLTKTAVLDNFCWPSVDDEITMGTLVRACEGCRDASLAYGIPFISGKDSLHNQFTIKETGQVIRIPRTLLISAISVVDDVRQCQTMDLKHDDGELWLIAPAAGDAADLTGRLAVHTAVSDLVRGRLVSACHDVSDGGVAVNAIEMAIASGRGLTFQLASAGDAPSLFDEPTAAYLVEIPPARAADVKSRLANPALAVRPIAKVSEAKRIKVVVKDLPLADLDLAAATKAWRGTLDW
jgi:phosphoribosylformylglycinamidine synthase